MKWGNKDGKTLSELRYDLQQVGKEGHWYTSDRFTQIEAAYKWHIPWHIWRGKKIEELDDYDRVEMMVFLNVIGDMEAWEQYVSEPK